MASHNILCKNLDIHASLSDLAIVSMLSANIRNSLNFHITLRQQTPEKMETIIILHFFNFCNLSLSKFYQCCPHRFFKNKSVNIFTAEKKVKDLRTSPRTDTRTFYHVSCVHLFDEFLCLQAA